MPLSSTKCPDCWQKTDECFCKIVETVKSPLRLLILQHPQEARNTKSTSRLLALSMPGSIHRVGLSWRSLSAAYGQPTTPKEWGVLYLGTRKDSAERAIAHASDWAATRGLIVLDGNWKQSKTLWWRNPWLIRVPRIVLNPEIPSEYGALRREPRKNCVSTLESVALCFQELNHGQVARKLEENQKRFLDRFLLGRIHEAKSDLSEKALH